MKRTMWILGLATFLVPGTGLQSALAQHGHEGHDHAKEEAKEPAEALCPIMEKAVNFAVSMPTMEGPVYFCCRGCIKKYQAEPQKFAGKVAQQRKALAPRPKVQVKCPVNGDPVDKKQSLAHDGKDVFFCTQPCLAKFKENPGKYKSTLANSFTYQTHCPVMEGKINPKAFSVLPTGETVYYCCQGCERGLFKDPAKYLPNLEKQGITVNLEALQKALKSG